MGTIKTAKISPKDLLVLKSFLDGKPNEEDGDKLETDGQVLSILGKALAKWDDDKIVRLGLGVSGLLGLDLLIAKYVWKKIKEWNANREKTARVRRMTNRRVAEKLLLLAKKINEDEEPYGEVSRQTIRGGKATIVVRKIFHPRKDDIYHVRVLKGKGLEADEKKRGNILWRSDEPTKAKAAKAAREWLKSEAGQAKLSKITL